MDLDERRVELKKWREDNSRFVAITLLCIPLS